jgi:hypothetical protein
MNIISKQINILNICSSIILLFCANSVQAIPPEQIFPNGLEHLENLGGGWIPLNDHEAKYGGNLDEGSYWYQLNKDQEQVYLILEQLEGRTADGTAIMKPLDVVKIPELINQNVYGMMRGSGNDCWYPNNQIFQDSRVLMVVKYNTDTATPIKSFRANLETKKWEIPPASIIKGLVCELYIP